MRGELSPVEQQLVAIAATREGNCHYCVAAHSAMAVGAKIIHSKNYKKVNFYPSINSRRASASRALRTDAESLLTRKMPRP